jgi:DNA-binding MarR family transcriptional regulator
MSRKVDVTTDLILTVFRLNGRLIDAGNGLVKDLGLTSAWWQVLGALSLSPMPLPVAHIARNMGLARQSVQRITDLLANEGMVRFAPNPHHQRAKLLVLTDRGAAAVAAAGERQRPWACHLAAGLTEERLIVALEVLTHMDRHLAKAVAAADGDYNRPEGNGDDQTEGTGRFRLDPRSTQGRE